MTAASFWPLYREVFKASRDNYLDEWGPFELFPWISISETYILLNSVVATQQLSLLLQWTLFSVYKDEGRLKRKHLTQLSDWLDVLQLVVHWVCSSVL